GAAELADGPAAVLADADEQGDPPALARGRRLDPVLAAGVDLDLVLGPRGGLLLHLLDGDLPALEHPALPGVHVAGQAAGGRGLVAVAAEGRLPQRPLVLLRLDLDRPPTAAGVLDRVGQFAQRLLGDDRLDVLDPGVLGRDPQ